MKKEYNWWADPKNAEEVYKVSWWEHPENKTTFELPISVIQEGNIWIATCNNDTEKLLGESFHACAQGDSEEDAVKKMFTLIRSLYEYEINCARKYQCWVPFRKGNWKRTGGRWFSIFGLHFYFRSGKGMKGGKYIPFTKLNISLKNEWL